MSDDKSPTQKGESGKGESGKGESRKDMYDNKTPIHLGPMKHRLFPLEVYQAIDMLLADNEQRSGIDFIKAIESIVWIKFDEPYTFCAKWIKSWKKRWAEGGTCMPVRGKPLSLYGEHPHPSIVKQDGKVHVESSTEQPSAEQHNPKQPKSTEDTISGFLQTITSMRSVITETYTMMQTLNSPVSQPTVYHTSCRVKVPGGTILIRYNDVNGILYELHPVSDFISLSVEQLTAVVNTANCLKGQFEALQKAASGK